jgi:hypothetical protein
MLFGYLDAAYQETIKCVTQLTPAQFDQPLEHPPDNSRPAWQALAGMCGDSYQPARHTCIAARNCDTVKDIS